jgi:ABC-type phosphate transport system substrate-binding protein
MVDAITSGFDLRAAIADATKKGSSSLNADDFDVTEFLRVDLKVGVHPDNSVQNLTDAQLTDILSGKTKSWRAISGQDIPIQLIIAKNYVAIDKLISDHFLHGQKSPVAQYVLDKEGMFKGVQGNKGAIGFFSLKESLAGFTPKFLPTSISHSSYFIIRKDARPPVRKVFELVRGETKTDK